MAEKVDSPKTTLKSVLRQCRSAVLILVAFGFVINLLYLVAPLYMLQVFDRVLASQQVETLLLLTLIARGAGLADTTGDRCGRTAMRLPTQY